MVTNIMITRVEDDSITTYLSKWVERKIIPQAEKKGFNVIDLHKKKAVKETVQSIIQSIKPLLVLFHGHGNDEVIAGYRGETLIHSEENAHLLGEKVVHSLTCSSAKILGQKAVKDHRALAFIGYNDPFFALNDELSVSRPLADEIAKPFLESSMKVSESLIKGNTTGEAFKKSQDLYNFWIAYYRKNGHLKDASDIILYLTADRDSQVLVGNRAVEIRQN